VIEPSWTGDLRFRASPLTVAAPRVDGRSATGPRPRAASPGRRQRRAIPSEQPKHAEEATLPQRADDLLLGTAFLSSLFSIGLWFSGLREEGVFEGRT
jgi:hypothetical protein